MIFLNLMTLSPPQGGNRMGHGTEKSSNSYGKNAFNEEKMGRATVEFYRAKINVLPGQNRAKVGQKAPFYSQNTLGLICK